MARRRGKRHASASTGCPSEVRSATEQPRKRQKTCEADVGLAHLGEVRLSEEQQDRLGRYSSSVQWIIKIAQDRGANACLAVSSGTIVALADHCLKARLVTADGQSLSLTMQGEWTSVAARVLSSLGEGRVGLMSGLGARISSSGNEIHFDCGKFVAEVWHVSQHCSHGYLEVAKGQIVKEPDDMKSTKSDEGMRNAEFLEVDADAASDDATIATLPSAQANAVLPGTSQPILSHAAGMVMSSAAATPVRSTMQRASSASMTPSWLRTPANDAEHDLQGVPQEHKSKHTIEISSPIEERRASSSSNFTTARQLGPRVYVPISLLKCDDRALVNVIGLTTTDHCARRSLSGSRDWKITIGLVDVEGSKDPHCANISFNLFSAQEDGLPRCKPASVLLLRGAKVRAFNSYPQGNGYPGQFEWAFMDTSEGDHRQALHYSENMTLADAERKELKRQYDWYRKRNKGQLQPAKRKPTRPLINLSAVEKEVFFDTTVEIVKIWSGSLPPQIYVTDYTSHPLFYAANDVCLGVLSREELAEQQEDCNDAGNGRVLPISLWDDQQEAINSVHIGMLVRLENVRPKIQPSSFLEGTMGGSSYGREEKLKVIVVKERSVLEEFQKRKHEYIEEVAVKRADKMTASRVTPVQDDDDDDDDDEEEEDASGASTPCMPPPGQRPLAVVENRSEPSSHPTESSLKSNGSRHSLLPQTLEEEEEALTLLEESLSALPCTSVEQLNSLTRGQLGQGSTYVCEGRVYDMQPSDLHNFVEVVCGLCKIKLPSDHAFCAKCAEEDGKDLTYRFNFAFLVEATHHAKIQRGASEAEQLRIPILVQGESAKQFLHGFHPKDVRTRPTTRERLRKRLLPLLGSQLLSPSSDSASGEEWHKPLPFRFAVRGTFAKKADGSLTKRFSIIHTRLERRETF